MNTRNDWNRDDQKFLYLYSCNRKQKNGAALEYSPSHSNTYVVNYDSGTVSVIDTNSDTIVENVVVDNEPTALEFNFANNNTYVANRGSRTVSVIDGTNNTLIEKLVVGS